MRIPEMLSIFAVALFMGVSCSPESKEGDAPVSKTYVSFGISCYADGTPKPFILESSDEVALVHAQSGEMSVAAPISAGGASSMFLFGLKQPDKDDLIIGYYPADAAVSVFPATVEFDFPAEQDGTDYSPLYIGTTNSSGNSYSGNSITLSPFSSLVKARMQKGAYSVTGASLRANGGEKIAGTIVADLVSGTFEGSEDEVTVKLAEPLDCSSSSRAVSIIVPPMTLSEGFTVTFYLSDGSTVEYSSDEPITFTAGGVTDTDPASSGRQLIACGSSKVYLFDEKLSSEYGRYNEALIWSWDATEYSSAIGLEVSSLNHIDDAKPIEDNTKILVTSSYGWAAVVNISTGDVEWSATGIHNAHSAEILPGGRIAVAVSSGVDAVKLYDISESNTVIASYPLTSAHGVVWNDKTQRLYATGTTNLQVYKLKNWDGSAPELELEKTISTSGYVTGCHDLTAVDENTLVVAGNKAALFNITSEQFTALPHFNSFFAMKSLNYNSVTGEAYYTYAGEGYSEGDYAWSSHKVRYTDDVYADDGGTDKKVIEVTDINMYKVRVMNW